MVDVHVKTIMELIKRGKSKEQIAKQLNLHDFDELCSVAKTRLTTTKTSEDYYLTEDDLRFATNELVAQYRAKRLACDTLVDVGCGVGIQTIAFARTCKRVIAIDIDKRKIRYALENAKKVDANNIEFIHADGLKALQNLVGADIVFVDPERAPEEKVRSFDTSFRPPLRQLIDASRKLTPSIAIELPPQIQKVDLDCEKEFISVDHSLNRLTVYLGDLKRHERSAVLLPGHHELTSDGSERPLRNSGALKYMFEVDPAVAKAGLSWKLGDEHTFLYSDERDTLLTSNTLLTSTHLKARYELVDAVENKFEDILAVLMWENAGKVVLRQKLAPDKYWTERRKYESRLRGDKTLHVFVFAHEALVCRKLEHERMDEPTRVMLGRMRPKASS